MLVPAAFWEAEQLGESVMGGLLRSAQVAAACFWKALPPSTKREFLLLLLDYLST